MIDEFLSYVIFFKFQQRALEDMSRNLTPEFWEDYFAPLSPEEVKKIFGKGCVEQEIVKEIQPTAEDMVNSLCIKIESIRDPVQLE